MSQPPALRPIGFVPLACALLALAGLAAPVAAAPLHEVFCVGNVAELDLAFTNAVTVWQSEIRMRSGSYTLVTTLDHHPDPNLSAQLTLSGGWDATCKNQSHNAALTVLDGGGQHGLSLRDEAGAELDDFTLLAYPDVELGLRKGTSAWVRIRNVAARRGGTFRIEGDHDLDCGTETVDVWISSSLFAQSSAAEALEITACKGDVGLDHLTVASNQGLGVLAHTTTGDDYGYWMAVNDSIFFRNLGGPLKVTSDNGPLFYPVLQAVHGNVGEDFWSAQTDSYFYDHNLVADPLLAADFRLNGGSPAIDFGRTPNELLGLFVNDPNLYTPPVQQTSDFDLGGMNRFVGPRPDAGAFEQPPRCPK